jgi:ubiquinone/menaquinone biosynthesis C-methylase UbiE
MLLNAVEKALMNNPVRAAIQHHFEAPRLVSMGGRIDGKRALEIGCGRGVGTEIILERFGARSVDAFDLDPHMVELAGRRLAHHGERVRLWAGDAEHIDAPDAHYDAAFDFGIVHHIPDWRAALREIHRVLVPGGRFYAEEVMRSLIANPLWRRLLDHPQDDRFDHREFTLGLEGAGFRVLDTRTLSPWFGWFVAEKPQRS